MDRLPFDILKYHIFNYFTDNERVIYSTIAKKFLPLKTTSFNLINALKQGEMMCLQYSYQKGVKLPVDADLIAGREGQLEVLHWLHSLNWKWHKDTGAMIVRSTNCALLKWYADHGGKIYPNLHRSGFLENALGPGFDLRNQEVGRKRCPSYEIYTIPINITIEELVNSIAEEWDSPALPFAEQWGRYRIQATETAIQCGSIELVQWIWDNHGKDTFTYCQSSLGHAAFRGHLPMLEWARVTLLPQSEEDLFTFELLKQVIKSTLPVERKIPILDWIHQYQLIPLISAAYITAVVYNSIEIVKWLWQHGCPWNDEVYPLTERYPVIRQWCVENGLNQ